MKKTGKQLKAINDQNMNPYQYLPQYGLGSWMKDNAGTIGSVVGAGIGTLIAPGIGTSIGSQLGGAIGGSVQSNSAANEANEAVNAEQQRMINTQQALAAYQSQFIPSYGAGFANGGDLFKSQIQSLPKKANGGAVASTKGIDDVSIFANGGTHEANPLGGIPIGNKGRVEQGEVKWKDFIFSNRF